MSNTISLVTQQHAPKLASPTNGSSAIVQINRYVGTTKPVSVLATSTTITQVGGTFVVPGGMNYLKIMPLWDIGAASFGPVIRVVGWSYSKDTNYWIPSLICKVTCTTSVVAEAAVVLGAVSLYPCTNIALNSSLGDAKFFSALAAGSNAFFVVDTLGFDLVELCFQTTTNNYGCNAYVSEI